MQKKILKSFEEKLEEWFKPSEVLYAYQLFPVNDTTAVFVYAEQPLDEKFERDLVNVAVGQIFLINDVPEISVDANLQLNGKIEQVFPQVKNFVGNLIKVLS